MPVVVALNQCHISTGVRNGRKSKPARIRTWPEGRAPVLYELKYFLVFN